MLHFKHEYFSLKVMDGRRHFTSPPLSPTHSMFPVVHRHWDLIQLIDRQLCTRTSHSNDNTGRLCLHRSPGTTTRTPWRLAGWTARLRPRTQWTLMPKGGLQSQRLAHTASPSPSRTRIPGWGWHALHISIPTVAFATPPSSMREIVSFVSAAAAL